MASIEVTEHTLNNRWFKDHFFPGIRQNMNGAVVENPIQDFLRSAAFDASDPYLVKKDVMATYVKSCAGYCVITYLLVRSAIFVSLFICRN